MDFDLGRPISAPHDVDNDVDNAVDGQTIEIDLTDTAVGPVVEIDLTDSVVCESEITLESGDRVETGVVGSRPER